MDIIRTQRLKKYVAMCDKLSQREIAAEMGMTVAAFNLKINGRRAFSLDELKKLIDILGIPAEEAGVLLFT